MASASARMAWSSNHGSSIYACDSGHRTSLYISFIVHLIGVAKSGVANVYPFVVSCRTNALRRIPCVCK